MRVYIAGVWDLLHIGHIKAIKQADTYGDVVVGIMTDELASKRKREPIQTLQERTDILLELPFVKDVAPYNDINFLNHLFLANAKIMCINEKYKNKPELWEVIQHFRVKWIPYTNEMSTTEIMRRCNEKH